MWVVLSESQTANISKHLKATSIIICFGKHFNERGQDVIQKSLLLHWYPVFNVSCLEVSLGISLTSPL